MTESVSQQITRLLGTADWVILHSGTTLIDDEALDDIEVRSDMQASLDGDSPWDRERVQPVCAVCCANLRRVSRERQRRDE